MSEFPIEKRREARIDEQFRYLELDDRTLLINSAHIVALTDVTN